MLLQADNKVSTSKNHVQLEPSGIPKSSSSKYLHLQITAEPYLLFDVSPTFEAQSFISGSDAGMQRKVFSRMDRDVMVDGIGTFC